MAGNIPTGFITVSGGDGNDELIGSEGSDALDGDAGNDRLEGRGGADFLRGGEGNDTVLGGAGNDEIRDGIGNDVIDAGADDDVVFLDLTNGFSAADQVAGGTGFDSLEIATSPQAGGVIDLSSFQIADDFEALRATFATIVVTAERLSHFQRFEALAVRVTTAGNFALSNLFKVTDFTLSDFGNGVDMSAGGPANYRVIGGAGADIITGSAFNDFLAGGGGNDEIHAGGGADTVIGGAGVDWIDGGAGDDLLEIAPGETVSAGDRFSGGTGLDMLFLDGATFGSTIVVTDLTGAAIDGDVERLHGAGLAGGRLSIAQLAGFSRLSLQHLYLADGGAVDFSGKETSGYLHLSDVGSQVTLSSTGFYGVIGGAGNDSILGSALGDDIQGNGGDDGISGGAGQDLLGGGGGNDILIGGAGSDALYGGTGDDAFYVDDAGDRAEEFAGEGRDIVYASVNFGLSAGSHVDILSAITLSGTDPLQLSGNELNQEIYGNAGANVLRGGGGFDLLLAGFGDDTYYLTSGGETIFEYANEGRDIIYSDLSHALTAGSHVEILSAISLSGTDPLQLSGNELDQEIYGNAGANILRGGGGNDLLLAGFGDDTYYITSGGETIFEYAGQGRDIIYSDLSHGLAAGSHVEILSAISLSSTAALNFGGNELDNYIYGNAGTNLLYGGGGLDTLVGGLGDDTYYVLGGNELHLRGCRRRPRHGLCLRQLHADRRRGGRDPVDKLDRRHRRDQSHRQRIRQHPLRQYRGEHAERRPRQRRALGPGRRGQLPVRHRPQHQQLGRPRRLPPGHGQDPSRRRRVRRDRPARRARHRRLHHHRVQRRGRPHPLPRRHRPALLRRRWQRRGGGGDLRFRASGPGADPSGFHRRLRTEG